MIPAEAEGRTGKGENGKARTREVKLCSVFTQTSLDGEGRPVRDPASSCYLATFAPAAGFGTLMAGEARRRGAATSASSSSPATARPGSGTSPASTFPRRRRSPICITPVSTCTA